MLDSGCIAYRHETTQFTATGQGKIDRLNALTSALPVLDQAADCSFLPVHVPSVSIGKAVSLL